MSQDEVKALPLPILGGGALLLAAIGLLFLHLERDRHLKQLLLKTGEIAAGEHDRLVVTQWRGGYRTLADRINQAIDKEVEKAGERAPTVRKKANLDEILGPTPEASGTPFFGFASDQAAAGDSPATAKPPAAAAKSPPTAAAKSAVPVPVPRPQAPSPSPVPLTSLPVPATTSPAAPQAAAPSVASSDEEASFDQHAREVYESYLATRRQCGESTDSLTFEKFGVTLRKTRDQIVEKQGVRTVRFSVQVKEGKAALKAQPIKR